MTTTIKSNPDGSSAIQTNGVDRIQIDTSGNPLLVNTPTTGDNSKKIATTEFVSNTALGVNQTWQNLTSSRALGTTYTNSTGKPIQIAVSIGSVGADSNISISINSVVVIQQSIRAPYNQGASASVIIPNGANYSATGGQVLLTWFELR